MDPAQFLAYGGPVIIVLMVVALIKGMHAMEAADERDQGTADPE